MKRVILLVLVFCLSLPALWAQKNYEIDIRSQDNSIKTGHLDLGGSNPRGDSISVNNRYIELNQKPFFPIVGEFHFSRYPNQYWEESILKMKAAGLNVIATYVFWNMHEREKGVFDWAGDLNLRRFIELCEKHDVYVIVRIGPFCHGEIRNGGLPDWLYGQNFDVRSNDPEYLFYVDRLYQNIGKQLQGMLFKDGGKIIGIQLENEFQHSAASWGLHYPGSPREYTSARRDKEITQAGVGTGIDNRFASYGKNHMNTLKRLAKEAGLDVPIYNATGWGNASIVENGSIPVMAAYTYPTWTNCVPSNFYLFKDIHKNPDYSPVSYSPEDYPSISAELGSGIMITNSRRPEVPYESHVPLIVRILGSGSNGIGYYMFHGGSTPQIDNVFYSEEVGGLPKINYDFQAPIGEFGQVRPSYAYLKTLHLFLHSYGEKLAPMVTILPETNRQIEKENTEILRYAVRAKNNSGFVFMHNYQDHIENSDLTDLSVSIKTANATIRIPAEGGFTMKEDESIIMPFNLVLGGANISYATVQPLTSFENKGNEYHVFFTVDGIKPEIVFSKLDNKIEMTGCKRSKGSSGDKITSDSEIFSFSFKKADGKTVNFLIVPRDMANQAWLFDNQLLFTDATVTDNLGTFNIFSTNETNVALSFYPVVIEIPNVSGAKIAKMKPIAENMSSYNFEFNEVKPAIEIMRSDDRHATVQVDKESLSGLNDVFLKVNYIGDRSMAFIDGKLVADHFYYGLPWEIGLRKFGFDLKPGNLQFFFHPLQKDAEYMIDLDQEKLFGDGTQKRILNVGDIEVLPEYKANMTINQ
ncbi:beta-galactosidase [Prolixibacteraceae bacterium Z1-6]|uniref:Beta-galactosidase n=1 Tax=Draconibacterium aestuarii TaxID=2998507 RepID=A0A9X3F3Q8_9BACT|nr:beta-galactosidase [Prolixibacteraceae bacterium Z1-6]